MKNKFIPKDKLSKKARRAEDKAARASWLIKPISRIKEGKKYNRQKFKKGESE